ncbi:hypothetical protein [Thermovenabulum sp.]|uniref:hypothetical protein n=1 Tax=Thermovenabulum sp. TaxID=3100335 RepID=UPI003C7B1D89
MSKSDIFHKIKRKRFYLNKINAIKINKEPSDNTISINQDASYSILEKSKDRLSVKVNTKFFVEPEALFSIELEYIIEFELNEEITDKEIEDNINEMITPVGGVSSYIVASITKEMLGSYLILPPTLKVSKVEKEKHI